MTETLKVEPRASVHMNHQKQANVHLGSFAGKRLRTEFTRCLTCGGALLSIEQTEERRRSRRLARRKG